MHQLNLIVKSLDLIWRILFEQLRTRRSFMRPVGLWAEFGCQWSAVQVCTASQITSPQASLRRSFLHIDFDRWESSRCSYQSCRRSNQLWCVDLRAKAYVLDRNGGCQNQCAFKVRKLFVVVLSVMKNRRCMIIFVQSCARALASMPCLTFIGSLRSVF